MTTAMSGIVDETINDVKTDATKIYDKTVDKIVTKGKEILKGGSANTGINGGAGVPGANSESGAPQVDTGSSGPSSTTKLVVIAGLGALLIYGGYKYMHKKR